MKGQLLSVAGHSHFRAVDKTLLFRRHSPSERAQRLPQKHAQMTWTFRFLILSFSCARIRCKLATKYQALKRFLISLAFVNNFIFEREKGNKCVRVSEAGSCASHVGQRSDIPFSQLRKLAHHPISIYEFVLLQYEQHTRCLRCLLQVGYKMVAVSPETRAL